MRNKIISAITTGAIGGILIMSCSSSTAAAGDTWTAVSKDALNNAIEADKGVTDPFPYSYTGAAMVRNYGWTPSAVHYLDAVLAALDACAKLLADLTDANSNINAFFIENGLPLPE